jgi:hypothetical protein
VPLPDLSRCSKKVHYSITSSARASSVGGTPNQAPWWSFGWCLSSPDYVVASAYAAIGLVFADSVRMVLRVLDACRLDKKLMCALAT